MVLPATQRLHPHAGRHQPPGPGPSQCGLGTPAAHLWRLIRALLSNLRIVRHDHQHTICKNKGRSMDRAERWALAASTAAASRGGTPAGLFSSVRAPAGACRQPLLPLLLHVPATPAQEPNTPAPALTRLCHPAALVCAAQHAEALHAAQHRLLDLHATAGGAAHRLRHTREHRIRSVYWAPQKTDSRQFHTAGWPRVASAAR